MEKETESNNPINPPLGGFSGREGFHNAAESPLTTAPGTGRLYMGAPAYDSDTLKARLKERIDRINQPDAAAGKNTGYLDNLGKTLSATAGGQGIGVPDLHKEATYSQDDLMGPFAHSGWNKTIAAGNGGQGAPLDPGYTQAAFRFKDISEPIVHTGNKILAKTDETLDAFGKAAKNRYAHTPDNDTDHVRALSEVNWDTPEHEGIKDLAVAAQASRNRTAHIAARMAADMVPSMGSPDTLMLTAASDYRHAPAAQTGKDWANARRADFLPRLIEKTSGILKNEREKLEALHSDDYKQRRLFDPAHNLLSSPAAVAGRLLEDVLPGVAAVGGLTQAMGGSSTSYLARLVSPVVAEGVAVYYEACDAFQDDVMHQPEADLVQAHPEYAALLGRYPDEIEARKALIRQKAPMYAYKKALKSVLISQGTKRFVRSTRTGDESKRLLAAQDKAGEVFKQIENEQKPRRK